MLKRNHYACICPTQETKMSGSRERMSQDSGIQLPQYLGSPENDEGNMRKQGGNLNRHGPKNKKYRLKNSNKKVGQDGSQKNSANVNHEHRQASPLINRLGKYKQKQGQQASINPPKHPNQNPPKLHQTRYQNAPKTQYFANKTESTCCEYKKSQNSSSPKFQPQTNPPTIIKSSQCLQMETNGDGDARGEIEDQNHGRRGKLLISVFKNLYQVDIGSELGCVRAVEGIVGSVQRVGGSQGDGILGRLALRIVIYSKICEEIKKRNPNDKQKDLLTKFQSELDKAIENYSTHKLKSFNYPQTI